MCCFAELMDWWINEFLEKAARAFSLHPIIHTSVHPASRLWLSRGPNKKPTTVSSRGFLSKSYLTTSANGVVFYDDDYQRDLSNP